MCGAVPSSAISHPDSSSAICIQIQHNEVTLLMLLTQVLEAGLNMHLAMSCHHVLAAPLGGAHPLRVQLEELLQAFDEPWHLLAILDLDSRLRD